MSSTTTEETTTENPALNAAKSWVEEHLDFTTIMIMVGCLIAFLSVGLLFCLIRYPSFEFEDKLARDRERCCGRRRKKRERGGSQDTVISLQDENSADDGKFRPLPNGDRTFQKLSNDFRLPTPGDALPTGWLPPIAHPMAVHSNMTGSSPSPGPGGLTPLRSISRNEVQSLESDGDGYMRRGINNSTVRWNDEVAEIASVGGMS